MASDLLERVGRLRLDAVLAVEAGDFETAYSKLLAVKVIRDTAASEQEKDAFRITFRDFETLMQRVEKERARASGSGKLRQVQTRFVEPGSCCDDPYFDCL